MSEPRLHLPERPAEGHSRADLEFLPAALEVIHRPPSPGLRALLCVLVAMVLMLFLVAWFGRLDIVAIAPGALTPAGQVHSIQAVQPGRIRALPVEEGAAVSTEVTILELDPTAARADRDRTKANLRAEQARRARLVLILDFFDGIDAANLGTIEDHYPLIDRLAVALRPSDPEGVQARILTHFCRSVLAQANGELIATRKAAFIEDSRRQILEKLDESEQRCLDVTHELAKAEYALTEQTLCAPIAGRLQHLERLTVGGVVGTGKPVMELVPEGTRLEFTARLPNKDLGHLALGQQVALKLDAFPFTDWGVVAGTLTYIAPGAIIDEKLGAVFVVRARFDELPPAMRQAKITLIPGMTGSLDIKTGSRSVLAYLLSPLVRAASESFHER
jgi:hemolysin D